MIQPPRTLAEAEQRCAELRAEARHHELLASLGGGRSYTSLARVVALESLGEALSALHVAEWERGRLREVGRVKEQRKRRKR